MKKYNLYKIDKFKGTNWNTVGTQLKFVKKCKTKKDIQNGKCLILRPRKGWVIMSAETIAELKIIAKQQVNETRIARATGRKINKC